jgi:hypothetical protein
VTPDASPEYASTYFVPRTENGQLPVYSKVRNGGGWRTIVRKVEGDVTVGLARRLYSDTVPWLAGAGSLCPFILPIARCSCAHCLLGGVTTASPLRASVFPPIPIPIRSGPFLFACTTPPKPRRYSLPQSGYHSDHRSVLLPRCLPLPFFVRASSAYPPVVLPSARPLVHSSARLLLVPLLLWSLTTP